MKKGKNGTNIEKMSYKELWSGFDTATHYGTNYDTVRKEFLYGGRVPAVYYCLNGFSDGDLNEKLIAYMLKNENATEYIEKDREKFFRLAVPFGDVSEKEKEEEALYALYSGNSVLLIEGIDRYIVIDTRHYPGRGIEEPPKDKVLRGSRDGFAEALAPNSALIRRRIRDNRLIFEKLTLGECTKTDLLVCYMDGLADKSYVEDLKQRISSVRTPGLNLGLETLSELLIPKGWYNPFPKVRYTERPDAAAAMLLEGSVILLCDNYPAAMILPTAIFDFLQDTDDFYFSPLIGGYMKLVRNGVYLISLLLTPIWYTLQQIPSVLPEGLHFLIYEGESFLPLLLQLLLVEIAVDGLKLASLNTPDTLSNSLGVISALIIGDMAVSVGWLSEQVILYMAFVAIANFTQPSYELGYAFKLTRILTLILISFLSYWGLLLGVLFTLLLIVTNRSISGSRSYLFPLIPFNRKALFRLFFRGKAKPGNKFTKGS